MSQPQGDCQGGGEARGNPHRGPKESQEFRRAYRGSGTRLLPDGTANSVVQVRGGWGNGRAVLLEGLVQLCPGTYLWICGARVEPVRGRATAAWFGVPVGRDGPECPPAFHGREWCVKGAGGSVAAVASWCNVVPV